MEPHALEHGRGVAVTRGRPVGRDRREEHPLDRGAEVLDIRRDVGLATVQRADERDRDRPVRRDRVGETVDQLVHSRGRRATARRRLRQATVQRPGLLDHRDDEERVERREVRVDRAGGNTGTFGEVANLYRLVTASGGQLEGRIEHPSASARRRDGVR